MVNFSNGTNLNKTFYGFNFTIFFRASIDLGRIIMKSKSKFETILKINNFLHLKQIENFKKLAPHGTSSGFTISTTWEIKKIMGVL